MSAKIFRKDLVLDGAMGTVLMERAALPAGAGTQTLNLTAPALVGQIHAEYVAAGSRLLMANTFGAQNERELTAGVEIALRAAGGRAAVALDLGPTGELVTADKFDAALSRYRRLAAAGARAGADCAVIETMGSLTELRAALIACKEAGLETAALMTFDANGRTFFGADARSFAVTAEGLGADAVGANCSLGPFELLKTAELLLSATPLPVVIKPNAGLPRVVGGRAVYDQTPETFALGIAALKQRGVDIVGGCCGTTPAFIEKIRSLKACPRPPFVKRSVLCSEGEYLEIDRLRIVGERINPTGKPAFRQALTEGRLDVIASLAAEQAADGADLLDVNVGIAGREAELMPAVLKKALAVTSKPLVIDSSSLPVLDGALALYPGKALVNSVSAKEQSLSSVLPLVKRYGASVVGLTLDDEGIPDTAAGRIALAEKIIAAAERCGIDRRDVYIDALTMAEASVPGGAAVTLETLKAVKAMGARTILGVSNISFGMPMREDVNAAFLEKAAAAGLDLAIVNPKYRAYKGSGAAHAFLDGGSARDYIGHTRGAAAPTVARSAATLFDAVVGGDGSAAAALTRELMKTDEPLAIASRFIIPALDRVGELYDSGELFLPQLISAADAASEAFALITAGMESGERTIGRFVIATVEGDIHDIGKNITAAVCRSYNVEVTDLGKDVGSAKILEALKEKYPCVLGLSALMTTTALNMRSIIADVRRVYPDITVLAGGAALNREFAEEIGAEYCATANDTANFLKKFYENA